MSLSNAVRTNLLDPTVHNNSRTEFRLPDAFYAQNLSLCNLGVYDTQATDGTGLYYPSIIGVLQSIRKLTLYSGSTIIDETQEFPALAAIVNLRVTNQGAEDLNRFELLNGTNLSIDPSGCLSYTNANKDYTQRYQDMTAKPVGNMRSHNQFQMARQQLDQTSGLVNLADYLGFLSSVPVLPMIPDLRLVIDWDLKAADFYQDPAALAQIATPSLTPIRPQLIAEQILGDNGGSRDFALPFFSHVVERFVVAAPKAPAGTVRSDSFRSEAFKAKFVKDLTFFNKVTTDEGFMKALQRSVAMRGEKLQLVINGQKYLPDQGIDQPAQKQRFFNDTIGSLNIPASAYYEGLTDASGRVICQEDNVGNADHSSDAINHNFSVTAVNVNAMIDRMDIEYSREYGARDGQSAAFTLLCFGKVARQLEYKGGVLRLSY